MEKLGIHKYRSGNWRVIEPHLFAEVPENLIVEGTHIRCSISRPMTEEEARKAAQEFNDFFAAWREKYK